MVAAVMPPKSVKMKLFSKMWSCVWWRWGKSFPRSVARYHHFSSEWFIVWCCRNTPFRSKTNIVFFQDFSHWSLLWSSKDWSHNRDYHGRIQSSAHFHAFADHNWIVDSDFSHFDLHFARHDQTWNAHNIWGSVAHSVSKIIIFQKPKWCLI